MKYVCYISYSFFLKERTIIRDITKIAMKNLFSDKLKNQTLI